MTEKKHKIIPFNILRIFNIVYKNQSGSLCCQHENKKEKILAFNNSKENPPKKCLLWKAASDSYFKMLVIQIKYFEPIAKV